MVDYVRMHDHQNRSPGTEAPPAASKKKYAQQGDDKLTHLDLSTESMAEFASRLESMADTVAQARHDAAGSDHGILHAALGLIGGDFVRVAGEAHRAHIADIDRLSTVVASVGSATRDATAHYVGTDESVRAALAGAERT